jgi:hypothetical protein
MRWVLEPRGVLGLNKSMGGCWNGGRVDWSESRGGRGTGRTFGIGVMNGE